MNGRQQGTVYRLLKRLPRNNNKIVLLDNFGGLNLDELHEKLRVSAPPELQVIRMTNQRSGKGLSLKQLRGVYHLATAHTVVVNNHIETPYQLRKDTYYVQIWHGTCPIKLIGQQMHGWYKKSLWQEPELLTSAITSSQPMVPIFAAGFGIPEERVLTIGSPSTDRLFSFTSSDKERLRKNLGLDANKTVILYAPTFREKQAPEVMLDTLKLEKLAQSLTDDHVIALRMHRLSLASLPSPLPDKVMDLSSHPLVDEVLAASDVLISDYSGVIFDFAILERPIILFPYDMDEYSDAYLERGLNLLPGKDLDLPVCHNHEQLVAALADLNNYDTQRVKRFKQKWFKHHDGRASARVADYLLKLMHSVGSNP